MSIVYDDEDFFKPLSAAVISQKKNREKNRKRKERAEQRKAEDEPEAKRKKTKLKSNTIVTSPDQRKRVEQFFHSSACYNGALNVYGVYCGLDNSTNVYYFYPVVMGPNRDSDGNVIKRKKQIKGEPFAKAQDYIPGAGNPIYIFTGLQMLFAELFPDKDATSYRKWDIYRFNNEYYGTKVASQAPTPKAYRAMLAESKSYGGARTWKSVHLVEDQKVSRNERSIYVTDFFIERKRYDLFGPLPTNGKVLSVDILRKIRENALKEKENDEAADAKVKKEVSSTSFSEKAQDEDDYTSDEYTSE